MVMVFAIHKHEMATDIYVSASSWTPFPPPSLLFVLSHSTGFGCPAPCMEPVLAIFFTYGNVHVSVIFSQIIQHLPSPTESKVCSLCSLCLYVVYVSFAVCRIVNTVFLNSIYMHQYTVLVFLCLTYFTLCNRFQVHPPHWSWLKCIPFYSWVILHCVYEPLLPYPFTCWWVSRLLPCPSYCK